MSDHICIEIFLLLNNYFERFFLNFELKKLFFRIDILNILSPKKGETTK